MKPKTKKIIIIAVAVALVVLVVWLVMRKRKSYQPTSIIDRLSVDATQKAALKAKVAEIEANTQNVSTWTREQLEQRAAANGYTYAQWVVVEAAYALYYASNWALYDAIATQIRTL